ncbi:hypothetical protein AVBRAN_a0060 (plasmid) [Campylobacter sp. RM12651]|nr:hypothetical protein AVBRAN_a0060 [Campylobacter sp. RM12651]
MILGILLMFLCFIIYYLLFMKYLIIKKYFGINFIDYIILNISQQSFLIEECEYKINIIFLKKHNLIKV